MMTMMAARFGRGKAKRLPPRRKFVAACRKLPPHAARCMDPAVQLQEVERCQKVIDSVDKKKMAEFTAMVR